MTIESIISTLAADFQKHGELEKDAASVGGFFRGAGRFGLNTGTGAVKLLTAVPRHILSAPTQRVFGATMRGVGNASDWLGRQMEKAAPAFQRGGAGLHDAGRAVTRNANNRGEAAFKRTSQLPLVPKGNVKLPAAQAPGAVSTMPGRSRSSALPKPMAPLLPKGEVNFPSDTAPKRSLRALETGTGPKPRAAVDSVQQDPIAKSMSPAQTVNAVKDQPLQLVEDVGKPPSTAEAVNAVKNEAPLSLVEDAVKAPAPPNTPGPPALSPEADKAQQIAGVGAQSKNDRRDDMFNRYMAAGMVGQAFTPVVNSLRSGFGVQDSGYLVPQGNRWT